MPRFIPGLRLASFFVLAFAELRGRSVLATDEALGGLHGLALSEAVGAGDHRVACRHLAVSGA